MHERLLEAARRSTEFRLHPLGFYYLQEPIDEGKTRRFHVWLPDGPDRPENDRHQHSYDIESVMIVGRMRSELFQFVEEHDGPEVEYAVSYNDHGSFLSPSGRKGLLLPIASFETSAGASYRLEAGVIHRVSILERPCITVLETQDRFIPIFSYGDENEAGFLRRPCTEIEAEKIRTELLRLSGVEIAPTSWSGNL